MHKICILLYCILSKMCIDLLCIISIMKSSRQKVLITEVRIIIRMEASELKQKKYTYMERLGALLYSANRMNTYMGRVTDADRHCLDVLRDMEHWAQETRQQTGRKQSGFLPVCCLPAKCSTSGNGWLKSNDTVLCRIRHAVFGWVWLRNYFTWKDSVKRGDQCLYRENWRFAALLPKVGRLSGSVNNRRR